MKSKSNYRISVLKASKCGVGEIAAIISIYNWYYCKTPVRVPSGTEIKLACRHNHVLVVRQHATGEPIVGILVFSRIHLFDGPLGVIEFVALAPGHEIASQALLYKAISYASIEGIERVEVPHRVLGVRWQHREALKNLGFQQVGSHLNVMITRE